MAIQYPDNPVDGQRFNIKEGLVYIYDATAGIWKLNSKDTYTAQTIAGNNAGYYTNYANLTNTPTIPSATSEFVNDSVYLTAESDTLNTVAARGATTTTTITIPSIVYNGVVQQPMHNMAVGSNNLFLTTVNNQVGMTPTGPIASISDAPSGITVKYRVYITPSADINNFDWPIEVKYNGNTMPTSLTNGKTYIFELVTYGDGLFYLSNLVI